MEGWRGAAGGGKSTIPISKSGRCKRRFFEGALNCFRIHEPMAVRSRRGMNHRGELEIGWRSGARQPVSPLVTVRSCFKTPANVCFGDEQKSSISCNQLI